MKSDAGPSTFDGVAIRMAVAEFLHNHPRARAKTLFATHFFHELTELAALFRESKTTILQSKSGTTKSSSCARFRKAPQTRFKESRWRGWRDYPPTSSSGQNNPEHA